MKCNFHLSLLFILSINILLAQKFELEANYGYELGAKLTEKPNDINYLKLDSGSNINISGGVNIGEQMLIKLSWHNQSTSILIKDQDVSINESDLSDINLNFILAGVTYYLTETKLQPYLGAGVGAAFTSFKNPNLDILNNNIKKSSYYAVNFEIGAVYWVSEKIGINLKSSIFSPVNFEGFNLPFVDDSDENELEATKNIKFLAPYLSFNIGVIFRL
ncbi:hypothetical protein [uncultured Algibacter sp.]|uniref:hypothetical protein n=1 Tax=uncultured Algibacter sp. TaxID=298659 RepID=UPI00261F9775|nr:hypothetical protein [uncultured Algibacter sp.]